MRVIRRGDRGKPKGEASPLASFAIKELRVKCESLSIEYKPTDDKDALIGRITEYFKRRDPESDPEETDCFGKPEFYDENDTAACKKCLDLANCRKKVVEALSKLGTADLKEEEISDDDVEDVSEESLKKATRAAKKHKSLIPLREIKYKASLPIKVFDVNNPYEAKPGKAKAGKENEYEITELIMAEPPATMGDMFKSVEKYFEGVEEQSIADLCAELEQRSVIQVG